VRRCDGAQRVTGRGQSGKAGEEQEGQTMMGPVDSIAQRLRIVRKRAGLSQAAMAEKLVLSVRTYKRYELGDNITIPVGVAIQVCTDFDVTLSWLLLGREEVTAAATLDLAEPCAEAVLRLCDEAGLGLSREKTAQLIRVVLADAGRTGAHPDVIAKRYISLLV
jgi:transcriptional regulator with XRE-family HTH domain